MMTDNLFNSTKIKNNRQFLGCIFMKTIYVNAKCVPSWDTALSSCFSSKINCCRVSNRQHAPSEQLISCTYPSILHPQQEFLRSHSY